MSQNLITVGGGVTGREHLRARRDGQDGLALVTTPELSAVVVTDGCSSGKSSEVGARLGAAFLGRAIPAAFAHPAEPEIAAAAVTAALITHLRQVAVGVSGTNEPSPGVVAELLLFGFLAAVVTRETSIVFGVGDGLFWVDGRVVAIDPGPENAPTYPGYALVGRSIAPVIHHRGGNDEAIAIATDGAEELVGPELDALVREPKLAQNPSLLRKRLLVLSDQGRLWDDTTIGIVRTGRPS